MFTRSSEIRDDLITAFFEGQPLRGREGDSVAATLIAAGHQHCRTTAVSDTPRAPYCMMGVCFDCLVVIDGEGNQQGCMVPLRPGMRIERQQGRREIDQ